MIVFFTLFTLRIWVNVSRLSRGGTSPGAPQKNWGEERPRPARGSRTPTFTMCHVQQNLIGHISKFLSNKVNFLPQNSIRCISAFPQ